MDRWETIEELWGAETNTFMCIGWFNALARAPQFIKMADDPLMGLNGLKWAYKLKDVR